MRLALLVTNFDSNVHIVSGSSTLAADSLPRYSVEKPKQRELFEWEIHEETKNTLKDSILMLVNNNDITFQTVRRWQKEDPSFKIMKIWMEIHIAYGKDVRKEFNMCHKKVWLENGILMYKTWLTDLPSVPVIPKTKSGVILAK